MTAISTPCRFLWVLPISSQTHATGARETDSFDIDGMIKFCQRAEELGIEQLLVGVGFHVPESFAYLATLIRETKKIKFLIAYRAAIVNPTTFVQLVNTLSVFGDDRVTINLLAGISPVEQKYYGDHLAKEDRHARLDEYIDICDMYWHGDGPVNYKGKYHHIQNGMLQYGYCNTKRQSPELFISGNSEVSMTCAKNHNGAWLIYSDAHDKVAKHIKPGVDMGLDVGLRMSMIIRDTKAEVDAKIGEMMDGVDAEWAETVAEYVKGCDSTSIKDVFARAEAAKGDWIDDVIWTGAVPFRGGPALAMAGTPESVSDYIIKYKQAGVSTFILSGWPQAAELENFANGVLPLVREKEAALLGA